MSRKKLILLLVVAVILVAVQLTGLGLAGRRKPKKIADYANTLGAPLALAPADLGDPDRCIAGNSLVVQPERSCMVTAASTWNLRRRVLSLQSRTGALTAVVVDHADRKVPATFKDTDKVTDLPVDREGVRILFSCTTGPPCLATFK